MENSELVNQIMMRVLLVLICIYALAHIVDKIITKVKAKKSANITTITNQFALVKNDPLTEENETMSSDKQVASTESQLPDEVEKRLSQGLYHLVLGTAEVLSQARLTPNAKVASQEDWDAAAKDERLWRVKYARTIIEVTEEYGLKIGDGLISLPFKPEKLYVILCGWPNGTPFTTKEYYSSYWK